MDLKTTTRPRRHRAEFDALRRVVAAPPSGRALEVANVGSGLAVKYFGRLSTEDVFGWDIFRHIDSGVRRIPMPDAFYENYETAEIVAALGDIPFRLTLIDIQPRVARVVARTMRGRSVDYVVADLGEERSVRLAPYRGKFDVVVAFAIAGRVKDKARDNARDNVRSLLRPGGIFVGGGDIAIGGFTPLAEGGGIFRKTMAGSA